MLWLKNMVILDANMILRYLVNDNAEMAVVAENYINDGSAYITIEAAAEVVYVLNSVYSMERSKIAEILIDFLDLVDCTEKEVLVCALKTYQVHKLDFVDCVLYGYNSVHSLKIATFDKKLLKLINQS
ncbi:MAG: PIN domain-containing protein [Oscillospiraceae bacterium]|nr:PIN domain-containing protein [Oscillospiraceae bacterium]